MDPVHPGDSDFRITVGGPDCTQPCSLSILNISAMSFGALSANAVLALNKGAALGNFATDTGEGGFRRYHPAHHSTLILNFGPGNFGSPTTSGKFSEDKNRKT